MDIPKDIPRATAPSESGHPVTPEDLKKILTHVGEASKLIDKYPLRFLVGSGDKDAWTTVCDLWSILQDLNLRDKRVTFAVAEVVKILKAADLTCEQLREFRKRVEEEF
jgi:hypothetical protein